MIRQAFLGKGFEKASEFLVTPGSMMTVTMKVKP
jgi:hypothetical protein